MIIRRGVSFEVMGVWRKESVECEVSAYPEATYLDPARQVAYVGYRLDQLLYVLRWQAGAIDAEQYQAAHDAIEKLAAAFLPPPSSPPGGTATIAQ